MQPGSTAHNTLCGQQHARARRAWASPDIAAPTTVPTAHSSAALATKPAARAPAVIRLSGVDASNTWLGSRCR